jgi:hypothetical protein
MNYSKESRTILLAVTELCFSTGGRNMSYLHHFYWINTWMLSAGLAGPETETDNELLSLFLCLHNT